MLYAKSQCIAYFTNQLKVPELSRIDNSILEENNKRYEEKSYIY